MELNEALKTTSDAMLEAAALALSKPTDRSGSLSTSSRDAA
jgi:hypothetical protein